MKNLLIDLSNRIKCLHLSIEHFVVDTWELRELDVNSNFNLMYKTQN